MIDTMAAAFMRSILRLPGWPDDFRHRTRPSTFQRRSKVTKTVSRNPRPDGGICPEVKSSIEWFARTTAVNTHLAHRFRPRPTIGSTNSSTRQVATAGAGGVDWGNWPRSGDSVATSTTRNVLGMPAMGRPVLIGVNIEEAGLTHVGCMGSGTATRCAPGERVEDLYWNSPTTCPHVLQSSGHQEKDDRWDTLIGSSQGSPPWKKNSALLSRMVDKRGKAGCGNCVTRCMGDLLI